MWLCRLKETELCLARGNSQLLNIIIHEYFVIGDVPILGFFKALFSSEIGSFSSAREMRRQMSRTAEAD